MITTLTIKMAEELTNYLKDIDIPKTPNILYKKINEDVLPLLEVIELGVVRDTETQEEWFDKASGFVSYKEPMEDLINKISEIMDLGFSKDLGFYFK
mgnify:CR=1 FL=1